MIANIKYLYSQVQNKTDFLKVAATELGKSYTTMRGTYFRGEFDIPEKYHAPLVELLQNYVRIEFKTHTESFVREFQKEIQA